MDILLGRFFRKTSLILFVFVVTVVALSETIPAQEHCPDLDEVEKANFALDSWVQGSINHSEDLAKGLSKEELTSILSRGKYSIICSTSDESMKNGTLTKEEEKRLTLKLVDYFKKRNLSYFRILGRYDGLTNLFAYMVLDSNRKEFLKLGLDFDQAAIIYGENGQNHLEYTFGPNKGKYHHGEGYEERPDAEDNYTFIRTNDNKPFKFCLNFDFDRMLDSPLDSPMEN